MNTFNDSQYDKACDELEELRAKLAATEAALAVEKHENGRWETVCDEMEGKLAAAEALLCEAIAAKACEILCTPGWYERAKEAVR